MMRKIILLALAMFVAGHAMAGDVIVHVASKHFTTTDTEWEEINPGLGGRIDYNDRIRLMAGGYRNSMGRLTAYAGVNLHTSTKLELGVDVGLASGYDAEVPVMLSPTIEYKIIKVNIIPVIEGRELTGAAFGLSFVF